MSHNLDLNDLDDLTIHNLIKELKNRKNIIDPKIIQSHFGKVDERCSIVSDNNKIKYTLRVYRGNKESDRFTVYIFFKETTHCLVRIDTLAGRHVNPDGSVAPKSHMHIYNNKYEKKDSVGIPIDIKKFPVIDNLFDVYSSFLKYTNIK